MIQMMKQDSWRAKIVHILLKLPWTCMSEYLGVGEEISRQPLQERGQRERRFLLD